MARVLDVQPRYLQYLAHRGPYRRLVDLCVHLLAVDSEELRGEGLAQEERIVDVEQGLRIVDYDADVGRHPRAPGTVGVIHEPGHPGVGRVLDEGLLLTQGVRIRHVAYVVDAVGGVLGIGGEPLPVLLVDTQRDLLEPEDGLHGLENLEELLKVHLVEQLVPPVAGLALGGVDDQVRLSGLVLEVSRETTTPRADDAGLAHDLHGLLSAQGLYFFKAALLDLGHVVPHKCRTTS
ncbi:MAG: hypothetical protein K0S10_3110 [Rubrobacteraceae bacterium]|nr:hypothetical protein [Rubrobacteraceae bacterium]